jgi:hypothetical protein
LIEIEAHPALLALDDEVAFENSIEPLLPIAFRLAYGMLRNDASALDPLAAMADSTGIWFSDYRDPNVIRHWQQGTGLRNVMVTGLPAVDQGTFPGAIPSSPCF